MNRLRFPRPRVQLSALMLALVSSGVYAQSSDLYALRGFGTVAATRTDDRNIGYRSFPQPTGIAEADTWTFDNDSLLGVQLDIAAKNDLSGTVQIIARRRDTGQIDPKIEWAFVKYQLSKDFRVRVGRVLTPAMMESDYRFVGYANTFIRPDNATYNLYPLSTHDGFDLAYQFPLGSGTATLAGYGGKTRLDAPANVAGTSYFSYESKHLKGLSFTWEGEALTARASYTDVGAYIAGPASAQFVAIETNLLKIPGALCPSCAVASQTVGNTLSALGYKISNIGARYAMDDWTVWGELSRTKLNDRVLLNGSQAMLIGISRSFAPWTPYATYSTSKVKDANATRITAAEIAAVGKVPQLKPLLAVMAGFNSPGVFPLKNDRSGVALGLRWDAFKNIALKGEILHTKTDYSEASPNPFPTMPNGSQANRPSGFNLYTLAVDFVF